MRVLQEKMRGFDLITVSDVQDGVRQRQMFEVVVSAYLLAEIDFVPEKQSDEV